MYARARSREMQRSETANPSTNARYSSCETAKYDSMRGSTLCDSTKFIKSRAFRGSNMPDG